ncbi:MAG TPA: cation:proton antiporter, partial [Pelovirga sp.]|nr:cation:proton antiporter [Pelovirga sp.]
MESQSIVYPTIILITGILVVLVMLIKLAFNRAGLPAIVGYLILGVLLRVVNEQWGFLGSAGQDVLFYLGTVGLTTLLFRVGLESNLRGLLKQLPKASLVGSCNLVFSGLVGYLAAIYVLDMSWITALIVGVALSATSVGISVAAWQDSGDLNSPQGEFLLDVAEFDDISAVLLMALLFILLPEIHQGGNEQLITQAMGTL